MSASLHQNGHIRNSRPVLTAAVVLLTLYSLAVLVVPALADDFEARVKAEAAGYSEGQRLERAKALFNQAQQLIDKGEGFGTALDLLIQVGILDPDQAFVEFELGRLFDDRQVGLKQRALHHYEAFIRLKPDDGRGLLHLANLYVQFGRMADADRAYKAAVTYDPASSWFWMEYARFLVDHTDRYQEASDAATQALASMNPADRDNDAWPWRHRGLAQARLGHWDKARPDLEKALAIFRQGADTWQETQIQLLLSKQPR
jgi:tetratricopeptide (TPR) repeat protein